MAYDTFTQPTNPNRNRQFTPSYRGKGGLGKATGKGSHTEQGRSYQVNSISFQYSALPKQFFLHNPEINQSRLDVAFYRG